MSRQKLSSGERPEIAFYYPGPVWATGEWIKSLLLFFDGVALLVPSYLKDKPAHSHPEMVIPLLEQGLLTLIEPESAVDKSATEQLSTALVDVIASGVLDHLSKDGSSFHSLSWSRLGGYGDEGLARMLFDELKARGLARDSEDGFSIPMHPLVRALVLVLLAQILRAHGQRIGMDLAPTTDRPEVVDSLRELLNIHSAPTSGQVVSLDLAAVGVDVSKVPLDEVLGFRAEHLPAYRHYATSVRRFVRDVSLVPVADRGKEFEARKQEIEDIAGACLKASAQTWKKAGRFALGIAGAAWNVAAHNPVGAALGFGGAILALERNKSETGAYSYLFRARDRFG